MKLLVFLIGFVCFSLVPFEGMSSDTTKVRSTTIAGFGEDFSIEKQHVHVDTILHDFYHYRLDARNLTATLGNPGLAYNSILFKPLNYGFHFGESSFLQNFDDVKGNKVYYTTEPFARVSYRDGPKKYQDFDVLFSQNINKRLNFTISFNTQSSTGYFSNQTTITKRFDFQSSYTTKKEKYGYFFNFKVRNGYANENGGIESDSIYNELTKLGPLDSDNNKLKVLMWQADAINNYDHRKVYFSQYFRVFQSAKDSISSKSVYIGTVNQGGFDDVWFKDSVIDSAYYDQFSISLPDSGIIYDKSKLFYLQNNVFFKFSNYFSTGDVLVGGKYNYYDNDNLNRSVDFTETSIYLKVSDIVLGKMKLSGLLEKGLTDYNKEGHHVNASLKIPVKDSICNLTIKGWLMKSLPEYKSMNYGGNYIDWNNAFDYSQATGIMADIKFPKIKLDVNGEFEINEGFVYYGSDVQPVQYNTSFYRYQLTIKKKFVFGKYHFDVSVINQNVESGSPVNLAEWVGIVSFYYQRLLFKDAMEIRYGIDYWQNSSYFAQAYAPFTRSFVYQNVNEVGDFPYINFYVSARIKGAQGFVNFQNVGQFVFRDNYSMIPGYAMQDFGIAFGLRWDFYN